MVVQEPDEDDEAVLDYDHAHIHSLLEGTSQKEQCAEGYSHSFWLLVHAFW